ncbi:MAG: precorrin-6y C5,15-methyltransferase (decarboxylating) subunit CbiE [Alphaproteobacteria bacterium]|jgi:precorrin-6B C5,15-methyltransferase / cobalt-precorrin-6B C5,C15-methyltransferase|nr:precorrin-6y C5,15-methyltransferase (decarboxylating) subunit CbiE [Alphaproteobacteria bacterium]MBT4016886.1 precorrin-6y C5,15-methyltransferase (decarboxylating) subunit CbiE [Alphaproteobacteria bacterium]MBT4965015.1 precorrin-6y C5,15-methyltransferase (decarboxylating) subunit CbiE [Alphaproteobacteria bacterium]MBT5161078.1 precorrin-6y C5,15-methyltransferase (decarboxylating) subunit CbiE [Alphaproteobacteria bacterium]MBT5916889.1 precorrin-6y C5,15-methyltransferase (decarboxyl
MTTPWLFIVGVGEDGLAGLSASARSAFDTSEVIIGGKRHLAMLGKDKRPQVLWDSPLGKTLSKIKRLKGKRTCVLATGDPMTFGVGVTLIKKFGPEQCAVYPHQSAFSLAAARLGWSLADVNTLTLHGRPLSNLNRHLRPNTRLLALANDGHTANQVSKMLTEAGYGESQITVFEHMGGPKEKRHEGIAKTWKRKSKDLNTIAISCVADPSEPRRAKLAGLPDDLYQHDGQLTKQEVRAVTLAALSPAPNDILWDVGAGAGSVAIEFLRAERTAKAIAIEHNAKRIKNIKANAQNLGVEHLKIIQGRAPQTLMDLEKPTVIFIGGGVGNAKVLQTCWRVLKPGGRLVANSVSIEGETRLFDMMRRYGGTMTQVAISHLDHIGDLHAWRAMRPVIQYRVTKT